MRKLLRRLELMDKVTFSWFDRDSSKALAAKTLHSVLLATLPLAVLYVGVVVPLFVVRKALAARSGQL